ncbi:MAG: hypothetical protein ACD_63C00173G0002 [uncultured bacterium]|nr:MAG: hypothetical protein ACD_63C00173G0002 [uncultured bacterium]
MSLKIYIIGMIVATLVCFGVFCFVLFFVDPDAGKLGVSALYMTLFMTLVGIFTLFGYRIRVFASKGEELYAHMGMSLRQGILFSIAVVGILFLQSLRILNWWDGGLLVGFLILLEFFFLSRN